MKLIGAVKNMKNMYDLLQKRVREGDLEAYELICRIEGKTPEQLKPCPFCGGQAEAYKDDENCTHVRCAECWAETDGYYMLEPAIENWNMRIETRPQHDDEGANTRLMRLTAAAPELYELLKEELIPTSDYGGTLSISREAKVKKLLARIDGKDCTNCTLPHRD